MAIGIRRRDVVIALSGATLAWPFGVKAEARLPTVGFLGPTTASNQVKWTSAFVQRLRELGWIEGRTITIEYRWEEGRKDRYAELAAPVALAQVAFDAGDAI